MSPTVIPWRSEASLAALALGEDETAQDLSESEFELAQQFGPPRVLGIALRAAGLVPCGVRGEQLLEAAVDVLKNHPDNRLEHARALTDLGALLRRGKRHLEARGLLAEALDQATRLGATALAARAEVELRATGAKPRRVRLNGIDALTASERRIATLAAEGHTNRDIAQMLFVTPRTIEAHLTSVFAKLELTTRRDLGTALGTPPS